MNLVVKKETASELKLELRPGALILFIAGLIFIGAGLIVIRAMGDHIVFAVENGRLRYEKHSLLPRDTGSFSLEAASVSGISIVLREKFSPSYEVVVESGGKVYDTSFVSADGEKKREIAKQSLEALSREGGTFHYEEDGRLAAIILGGTCVGGGLICWLAIQVVTITADRRRGTLTIHRRRRLLPWGEISTLKIGEIHEIRIIGETTDTGKHQVTSYQVWLDHQSGKPVPVAKGPMFTDGSAADLRRRLAAWLQQGGE